ncbi:MAG: S41 family peptidase [Candidatus Liptonbacteria bacterium]|nr:S41 family peptidase [Candidatus Liptonbacteria bacterium]
MLKKKVLPLALIIVSIAALLGSGYIWGLRVGKAIPEIVIAKGVSNVENQTSADFRTFWEAWKIIDDSYLRAEKVDGQARVYGAIRGLIGSLEDPYSEFFTPEQGKRFQQTVQGNFGGIGAELGMRKGILTVIAPLKNSPAEKVGIKAGDLIYKINATSTDGLGLQEAVDFIRGRENTEVTLSIFREEWESPKDFKIVRGNIEVPTVKFEMKDNFAYIALYAFNGNASKEFYNSIKQAADKNAEGLILDLRDDPGGFLDVAVELAGWFLKNDTVVVSENDKTGPIEVLKARGNAALVDFPVVILINGGSASASEILAGALRDQRGVKLIGETSFGKGTVQQLKELRDGSQMKVTIAHWVLPSGHILESGGLKPDFEVKITDKDIENKVDPQLDKAIEVLKSQIQ